MKSALLTKIYLSLVLLTMIGAMPSYAQADKSQQTLLQVLEALEKADLFVRYRSFKNDFERMNRNLAPQLSNPASYYELEMAYTQVERQFNGLLELIKRDLSDYKRIQEMTRQPLVFAERYSDHYARVLREYELNYRPVYNRLNVSKAIPPALIAAGMTLILEVITILSRRSEMKAETLNLILGTINTYFYDKMRMKSWDELGFAPPSAIANAPYRTSSTAGGTSGLQVHVQQPVFDELSGWVEFVQLSGQGREVPMSFDRPLTKNITIETRRIDQGSARTDQYAAGVLRFETMDQYDQGTQFLLRVKNTAGMYVLALNSGHEVLFLYPYANDALSDCRDFQPVSKDIGIGYLAATPVVGKDRSGVTVLPTPDCRYNPPVDRYFTISGDTRKEELAIILTRSELDVESVRRSLQAAQGNLDERLARVFGTEVIPPDGTVSLSNNRMEFKAGRTDRSVLPVVFQINRR
jgi:hypothetical protein